MPSKANYTPTEGMEQAKLFSWAHMQTYFYPELDLMFHVPNGGSRGKAEAGRFRAEGVKAGVPDICLPVPRGQYHGLFIEMKRQQGGRVSPEQKAWLDKLQGQGYLATVCRGWEEASNIILAYLDSELQAM